MKKGTKIIFSTIMIVMMVILTVAPVFAATTGAVDPKTLTGSSNANTTTMQNIGNQIITAPDRLLSQEKKRRSQKPQKP